MSEQKLCGYEDKCLSLQHRSRPETNCLTLKLIIMKVFELFTEGGLFGMAILTILLVLMLFAAWKAPAWVKEIGLAALVWGFFWQFAGIYQMLDVLQTMTDVPMSVIYGGAKVTMVPAMYGMLIYLVSLIIILVQKPRL